VDSLRGFWDATVAFWDGIASVSWQALLIALALHASNLLLRSYAWRNILQAAHPYGRVRWRSVAGAYLAGVGINSVVPARGGDVMKAYLVHRANPGLAYPTIVASLLVETLVDMTIAGTLLLWAYSTGKLPGLPDLRVLPAFEWTFFANHGRWFVLLLALVLIAVGVFFTHIERRATAFWDRTKAGLAIVRTPRVYARRVAVFQVIGWGCRITAMVFFLRAFHIDATLGNALLVICAASLSTLLPFTPGGAGTQQAVLVYMFRGVATSSAVLSFSVGMQFSVTLLNALVAGVIIAAIFRQLPWRARVPTEAKEAVAKP
jgi:uncharacterized protein (TIRG00374 family)